MQSQKIILSLVLAACAAGSARAQSIGPSAIDAAGGSSTAAGITHEYAIGQVVAGNSFISAGLVVTPGVLQPQFDATGIAPHTLSQADVQVYPNPVETLLYLQPAFRGSGILGYSLYDVAGKLVLQRVASLKTGTEQQSINVQALAAGQYNLQISWQQNGETAVSSYKIQKLQ